MFFRLSCPHHVRPFLQRLKFIRGQQRYLTAAATPKLKIKTDDALLGYSVKQVEEIPELNLTALLLEHIATGTEHLHLSCDDSNNLFGVQFRTPPSDNTGVTHILEHLALCGSKRFPCRDPFFNMLNRSLSTFMNAFTSPDATTYAFSTQNVKDFQNLLSVYLDATFFPALRELDFRQEGWRLEHENVNDKNSPIIFKGVVFNEMKGIFSDPNQFYLRALMHHLFPCNAYANESGGDPMAIPSLSWQQLKHFHSTLYHPTNSRFFTYGNMSLKSHLEHIETHVLQHFKKAKFENSVSDAKPWSSPKEVTIYNRFDPLATYTEKQTVLSQSYVLNRITDTYESFALGILGTLLVDGPNAPFYQNLLESGLGPDYSPWAGYQSFLKQCIFTVGLREISEKDVEPVKATIEATFEQVIKDGFSEKQVEGVLHRVELSTKHRTTSFGLNCLMGVGSAWNHDGNPINTFKVNDHVQWFTKQMTENPHFLQDKVVQYFKNNNHKLTLVMKPVEDFEQQEREKEKEMLESKVSVLTETEKLQIYQQGLELIEHQKNCDTSSLPSLQIDDVKPKLEPVALSFKSIGGIPVQLCETPTNEVVYFKAMVDASHISEEDILLLPLFASILTEMGCGSRNYKEFDQELQLKTSGFNVSLSLIEDSLDPTLFKQALFLSSYCLEDNVLDMFSLWRDVFRDIHLEDMDRLTQLIRLRAAELAQSISHSGHKYAMRKASSCLSLCADRREKMAGLTQVAYMKKLSEMQDYDNVLSRLKNISTNLFQKSSIKCALNATSIDCAVKGLESLLKDMERQKEFSIINSKIVNYQPKPENIHIVLPLSVNYLGSCVNTVPYCHPHFSSLKIAAKLLTSKYLHCEIREKGGAYGAGASVNKSGEFMLYSYRDPNITRTLSSFTSSMDWLSETSSYSDQDLKEAKLGVFSEIDAPVSPGAKGSLLFSEEITFEMMEEMRKNVFKCKREDIKSVAEKYLKGNSQVGTVLIGPENDVTRNQDHWTVNKV